METLINGYKFEVQIIYDNYHRIRADYQNGKIIIHAFNAISEDEINDFIKQKEKPLYNMIIRGMKREEIKDHVSIMGKTYKLKKSLVEAYDDEYIYFTNSDDIINTCIRLFYKDLYAYLLEKTKYYYNIMYKEDHLPSISLSNAKSYYGQYNKRDHHIKYNVILLFSEKELIDTVVVHELAHIRYMNHQKEFYDFVTLVLPNYKFLHNKLKKEGMSL